jgi:hypothetical protein
VQELPVAVGRVGRYRFWFSSLPLREAREHVLRVRRAHVANPITVEIPERQHRAPEQLPVMRREAVSIHHRRETGHVDITLAHCGVGHDVGVVGVVLIVAEFLVPELRLCAGLRLLPFCSEFLDQGFIRPVFRYSFERFQGTKPENGVEQLVVLIFGALHC